MCDCHVWSVCCNSFWSDCWKGLWEFSHVIVITLLMLIGCAGIILVGAGGALVSQEGLTSVTKPMLITGILILSIYTVGGLFFIVKYCCIRRYRHAQQLSLV